MFPVYLFHRSQVLRAIQNAPAVFIGVRFGASEKEVKLSKKEASAFVKESIDDVDAAPEQYEMYAGYFAYIDEESNVHLG